MSIFIILISAIVINSQSVHFVGYSSIFAAHIPGISYIGAKMQGKRNELPQIAAAHTAEKTAHSVGDADSKACMQLSTVSPYRVHVLSPSETVA